MCPRGIRQTFCWGSPPPDGWKGWRWIPWTLTDRQTEIRELCIVLPRAYFDRDCESETGTKVKMKRRHGGRMKGSLTRFINYCSSCARHKTLIAWKAGLSDDQHLGLICTCAHRARPKRIRGFASECRSFQLAAIEAPPRGED